MSLVLARVCAYLLYSIVMLEWIYIYTYVVVHRYEHILLSSHPAPFSSPLYPQHGGSLSSVHSAVSVCWAFQFCFCFSLLVPVPRSFGAFHWYFSFSLPYLWLFLKGISLVKFAFTPFDQDYLEVLMKILWDFFLRQTPTTTVGPKSTPPSPTQTYPCTCSTNLQGIS